MTLSTLEKISPIPEKLFSKILSQTSDWNFEKHLNFDPAFKKHYAKGFKVSGISRSKNTDIPEFLIEVINWIKSVIGDDYTPVQAMLNVILPNQQFPVHIDSLQLHQVAKRYHICLDNSLVDYYFFDNDLIFKENMDTGWLYHYNNLMPHCVRNISSSSRTNLILDMLPKNIEINLDLLKPESNVVKKWEDLKKKFYLDHQMIEFTKDSII
jgi:hypothetical protein